MRRSRLRRFLTLLLLLPMLAGCWSRRELTDIALVTTLGLDLTEDDLLDVTVGIALPGAGSGGGRGKHGSEGQKDPRNKVLLTRRGRTLSEALREVELAAPRQLNMTHAEVIIVGERLAEQGLDHYLDYIARHPQIRFQGLILLFHGTAVKDLMTLDPIMEPIQAEAIRELEVAHVGLQTRLWQFYEARATDYKSPLLPVLALVPHQTQETGAPAFEPALHGAAVLKGGRVALYLDEEQVNGVMWIQGKARGAVITVPCSDQNPLQSISFRVVQTKKRIRAQLAQGRLAFRLALSGTLSMTEARCPIRLEDPAVQERLRLRAEAAVKKQVEEVLRIVKEAKADPWMFGEYARAFFPSLWRERGGARWGETWSTTPVTVGVQLKVEYFGVVTDPGILKPAAHP
jgi:spore germination protein KC